MKRTALLRRTPLRSRPKRPEPRTTDREIWQAPHWGNCAVCGTEGWLNRHHVVTEQKLRQIHRVDVVWDLRDALEVGSKYVCDCHGSHHAKWRNGQPWAIALPLVPDAAVAFAVEVFGGDLQAADYLNRHYLAELPEGEGRWTP